MDKGLNGAVERFVDALTPLVEELAGDVLKRTPKLLRDDVTVEAYNISAAFIDADGRHTNDELLALVSTFGGRLPTHLAFASPDKIRSTGLLVGKRVWLERPSVLFDILVKAARDEPAFRWHAMTALASFDDVSTGNGLSELMQVESAETRYGAFRAMRARSSNDPLVSGDWLAGNFHLHEIPSEASPMIHFSRAKRPEIVLFGLGQTVADDFLHVETGLTVRGNGNGTVSVNSYSAKYGEEKLICSNKVSDVIRTLAKLDYGYGSLMKMFRAANQSDSLNTRLVVNAIPKLGRTYSPDESIGQLAPEKSDRYVAEPLPGLFNSGQDNKTKRRIEEETVGEIATEIKTEREEDQSGFTKFFNSVTSGGFE